MRPCPRRRSEASSLEEPSDARKQTWDHLGWEHQGRLATACMSHQMDCRAKKRQHLSQTSRRPQTSFEKRMLGASLHCEARNRFPNLRAFPSKATSSFVVGLKSSGIRLAATPGTSLASAKEADRAFACSLRGILSDCVASKSR